MQDGSDCLVVGEQLPVIVQPHKMDFLAVYGPVCHAVEKAHHRRDNKKSGKTDKGRQYHKQVYLIPLISFHVVPFPFNRGCLCDIPFALSFLYEKISCPRLLSGHH